jgi:hypothetical protein
MNSESQKHLQAYARNSLRPQLLTMLSAAVIICEFCVAMTLLAELIVADQLQKKEDSGQARGHDVDL